jgi:EpsI family protein
MKNEPRYWAMVALFVIASVGLHRMSHGEVIPSRRQFNTFPLRFELWSGSNLPIQSEILKEAGVDDYLSRVYVSSQQEAVTVYVGYYKSQRTGQSIHSPKNCLPGSGWQPIKAARTEIDFQTGRPVSVNLYIVEKGLQRELVLYWYQSHGRVIASDYWAKFYMVIDAIRMHRTDAALVRIATPIEGNESSSLQRAQIFAKDLMANLNQYLPR